MCRDITAEMEAERRLHDAETRFRRLYDSKVIGIVSSDEHTIREANDLFLEMTGYTREDLEQGRINWLDMTPPEYLPASVRGQDMLRRTGGVQAFEKEYIRKDGRRVPVLLGGTLLQEEPYRDLCFVVDLSERKRLEQRILEAQKFESLGVLAGGIAHDFNNLLVGVIGHASLAREMLGGGHPIEQMLSSIVSSGEQAANLIRQMLAYAGQGRMRADSLSLSRLIEESAALVRPSLGRGVALQLHLDPSVAHVQADRGQMQQIFTNLALNAAEAIGDLGGLITVRTGVREIDRSFVEREVTVGRIEPGRFVYMEVRDTGCGMDASTRAKIFDPFFSTKFLGRGLGLAAVAGIVRSHEGAMCVESAPDQGSRFLVLLPVADGYAAVDWDRITAAPDPRERGTVLVVDDQDVVRQLTALTLKRHGFQVLLSATAGHAAETFAREAERISLVLLDLSMPDVSGADLLPDLRRRRGDVPVLITSGHPEAETLAKFRGQPVAGFLQKPFSAQKLIAAIESAIAAG
jgi:PAS domain S-box-containing protein